MPFFKFSEIVIGQITLQVWGFFVALAVTVTYIYLLKKSKEENYSSKLVHGVVMWGLLGVLVGSRLGYILQYPGAYWEEPGAMLAFTDGGFMFMGGFLGAMVAIWTYYFIKRIPLNVFLSLLDSAVLILPVSVAVGRIGCFMVRDHQGAVTELPWAIIWQDGTARHPVSLYSIAGVFVIFLLIRTFRHRVQKPGSLFIVFVFLYSLLRVLLDFTRSKGTILSDPHYLELSTTQWLSLGVIFVILILVVIFKRSMIILKSN